MARVMVIGGASDSLIRFRGQLLRDMIRHGHQVYACAPHASRAVREELDRLGATYVDYPLQRTGLNPLSDLHSLITFIRLFRTLRPDVVLAYTIKPTIYGSLGATVARVEKISSLITGLGYAFSGETTKQRVLNWLTRRLYRLSLSRNQVVFFQNPDDLAFFREEGIVNENNQPTIVNGSGVDLHHYSVRPLPSRPAFLLIARLIAEKGIREYVSAARQLRGKYSEVSFRLVGMLDRNPNSIRQEELDSWVEEGVIDFLGRLDDVRPAIADSSVYVLPSYYREGVPRSTLEAMSMGRPVVTTDAPGCRETVIDGLNGFLVPVKSASALADVMERFILTPGIAATMGAASRRVAEEKFDVKQVNRVILQRLELANEASL